MESSSWKTKTVDNCLKAPTTTSKLDVKRRKCRPWRIVFCNVFCGRAMVFFRPFTRSDVQPLFDWNTAHAKRSFTKQCKISFGRKKNDRQPIYFNYKSCLLFFFSLFKMQFCSFANHRMETKVLRNAKRLANFADLTFVSLKNHFWNEINFWQVTRTLQSHSSDDSDSMKVSLVLNGIQK